MMIGQTDITKCSALELRRWLRWNDPNGIWDPLDPDYVELPKSELVSIIRRMISGE
jgi:hypothetical protein